MSVFLSFIEQILRTSLSFLHNASPWILLSFVIAACFHNVVTGRLIRKILGTKGIGAQIRITLLGMVLPICDCGTVPIGISMYYAGAYLGPVLNFVTATPMINPASLILSYGLLGPQLTLIYLVAGLVIPLLVGLVANRLAGVELSVETNPKFDGKIPFRDEEKKPWKEALADGFYWVWSDFGVTVSKFTVAGVLGAGFIMVAVPSSFVQRILGSPTLLSIGMTTLLASVIFV